MGLKYTTTLDFANVLNVRMDIPGREVGVSPSSEVIGTGDGTATVFYLDQFNIINGTQTLTFGTTSSVTTALAETTDYTLNLTTGKITLTAAGTAAVTTDNIYGESYSYNGLGLSDSYLQEVLERAEEFVDTETGTQFTDGDVTTPVYKVVTNEKQEGKGYSNRGYFSKNYPIANVATTLSEDAVTSTTSYVVASTNGFPTAGVFNIENDKITYTGKAYTSFTGCTGSVSAHSSGSDVLSYVIEVSTSAGGATPSWEVLQKDIDFDIDLESGRVNLFGSDQLLDTANTAYPPQHTKNRYRMSYLSGWNTIPKIIKRAVLIAAKHMLVNDTMSRSLIQGRDEFRPSILDAEKQEYEGIISSYESTKIDNT